MKREKEMLDGKDILNFFKKYEFDKGRPVAVGRKGESQNEFERNEQNERRKRSVAKADYEWENPGN